MTSAHCVMHVYVINFVLHKTRHPAYDTRRVLHTLTHSKYTTPDSGMVYGLYFIVYIAYMIYRCRIAFGNFTKKYGFLVSIIEIYIKGEYLDDSS